MLTLKDINRALDELGLAAFVPRTRRGLEVAIVVEPPIAEPDGDVIDVVAEIDSSAA